MFFRPKMFLFAQMPLMWGQNSNNSLQTEENHSRLYSQTVQTKWGKTVVWKW